VALGVVLLVVRLMPAEPDLAEALSRLSPTRGRANTLSANLGPATVSGGKERLGVWAMKALPPAMWVRTPTRELALLRVPLARFYGDKLTFAFLGLLIPPLLAWFFGLIGLGFPVAIPALASLGLAVVMFFLPNYNAVDDARKARLEFSRALGAYIDLVALERNNGSGVRQAMESAIDASIPGASGSVIRSARVLLSSMSSFYAGAMTSPRRQGVDRVNYGAVRLPLRCRRSHR